MMLGKLRALALVVAGASALAPLQPVQRRDVLRRAPAGVNPLPGAAYAMLAAGPRLDQSEVPRRLLPAGPLPNPFTGSFDWC